MHNKGKFVYKAASTPSKPAETGPSISTPPHTPRKFKSVHDTSHPAKPLGSGAVKNQSPRLATQKLSVGPSPRPSKGRSPSPTRNDPAKFRALPTKPSLGPPGRPCNANSPLSSATQSAPQLASKELKRESLKIQEASKSTKGSPFGQNTNDGSRHVQATARGGSSSRTHPDSSLGSKHVPNPWRTSPSPAPSVEAAPLTSRPADRLGPSPSSGSKRHVDKKNPENRKFIGVDSSHCPYIGRNPGTTVVTDGLLISDPRKTDAAKVVEAHMRGTGSRNTGRSAATSSLSISLYASEYSSDDTRDLSVKRPTSHKKPTSKKARDPSKKDAPSFTLSPLQFDANTDPTGSVAPPSVRWNEKDFDAFVKGKTPTRKTVQPKFASTAKPTPPQTTVTSKPSISSKPTVSSKPNYATEPSVTYSSSNLRGTVTASSSVIQQTEVPSRTGSIMDSRKKIVPPTRSTPAIPNVAKTSGSSPERHVKSGPPKAISSDVTSSSISISYSTSSQSSDRVKTNRAAATTTKVESTVTGNEAMRSGSTRYMNGRRSHSTTPRSGINTSRERGIVKPSKAPPSSSLSSSYFSPTTESSDSPMPPASTRNQNVPMTTAKASSTKFQTNNAPVKLLEGNSAAKLRPNGMISKPISTTSSTVSKASPTSSYLNSPSSFMAGSSDKTRSIGVRRTVLYGDRATRQNWTASTAFRERRGHPTLVMAKELEKQSKPTLNGLGTTMEPSSALLNAPSYGIDPKEALEHDKKKALLGRRNDSTTKARDVKLVPTSRCLQRQASEYLETWYSPYYCYQRADHFFKSVMKPNENRVSIMPGQQGELNQMYGESEVNSRMLRQVSDVVGSMIFS